MCVCVLKRIFTLHYEYSINRSFIHSILGAYALRD